MVQFQACLHSIIRFKLQECETSWLSCILFFLVPDRFRPDLREMFAYWPIRCSIGQIAWRENSSVRQATQLSMLGKNWPTNEHYKSLDVLGCGLSPRVCGPIDDREIASRDLLCSDITFTRDWWRRSLIWFLLWWVIRRGAFQAQLNALIRWGRAILALELSFPGLFSLQIRSHYSKLEARKADVFESEAQRLCS